MRKFRWAYIGCGHIAEKTAEEILRSGRHEIVSVWNRTGSRAEEFAARFGGKVYGTIEEAVCDPKVEGVYLAATADCRPEHLRVCIRNKRPALMEKPFAVNAGTAAELFREAAEAGVYVSEAMWTWHNKIALRVREWVRNGFLGEIREADFTYGYPLVLMNPNHRLRDPGRIGGALLDIGIYPVRYCYELFGMPREIRCKGTVKGGVDFREEVELAYEGFTARLHISMDRPLGERAELEGSTGKLVIPQPHAARSARLTGRRMEILEDSADLYAVQFTNVAAEIRAGCREGKMIPAKSTVDVMTILDECRRQMGLTYPGESPHGIR